MRALTKRSLVLEGGKLAFDGPVEAGLTYYTSTLGRSGTDRNWGRGKDATLVSGKLLDVKGVATDHFTPGTALRLQVVVETTGMPGMSLSVILRDQHNLPVGYYSSDPFSSVALPTSAGRYECTLSLDRQFLAAGEYNVDLQTTSTAIITDHKVDGARCSSCTSPAATRAMSATISGRIRASRAPCAAADRAAAFRAAVRCGDPRPALRRAAGQPLMPAGAER